MSEEVGEVAAALARDNKDDLRDGIGGFRLGMESAGHECIGFCEIDKFARTSYKAIHDTTGEVEMHDITTISDEFIRGIRKC